MRVCTLGTGTLVPEADRASSCVVVLTPAHPLVFDLGRGALGRLVGAGIDPRTLDDLFLTHLHPDHCADLVPLLFASSYGPGGARDRPLRIVGPEGTADWIAGLGRVWRWLQPRFPLRVEEFEDGDLDLGAARIRIRRLEHGSTPDLGYRVESGGWSMAFTGDTGPCRALEALAAGVDLLVAECAAAEGDAEARRFHLAPDDLGRAAARAGCRRLVVTHLYPPVRTERVLDGIRAHYDGPVDFARDGAVFDLGDEDAERRPRGE